MVIGVDMKICRIMADYSSSGLWDGDGVMASPDEFNLPPEIIKKLEKWCQWFEHNDAYLEDPKNNFDYVGFTKQGLEIAKEIKSFLGDEYTVLYFDESKARFADGKPRSYFEYEIK